MPVGRHKVEYLLTSIKTPLRRENKPKRLAFIARNKHRDFSKCVFLDGKTIPLEQGFQKLGSRYWQDSKNKVSKPPVNPNKKNAVHVYAAVTKNGRSELIRVPLVTGTNSDERFKSEHACVALLKLKKWSDGHFNGQPYHFVMDNAKQHTSKKTSAFIHDNNIPVLQGFPAQSPDLNIIENVWKMLEDRIKARRPRTLAGLWRVAREEWDSIDQQSIKKCVESLPKRMELIEERGGCWMWQQSTK